MIQNNYFNKPISTIEESVRKLESFSIYFENDSLSSDEKVKKITEIIPLINTEVSKNLDDFLWVVKTLDWEVDKTVLEAGFRVLNDLQLVLQRTTGAISQEATYEETKIVADAVHSLYTGLLKETIELTHEKMAKLKFSELLPEDREEGEVVPSGVSDHELIKSESKETSSTIATRVNDLSQNFIFTPGRFYNPIPFTVASYVQNTSVDSPDRLEDFIGLIKGERIDTAPHSFTRGSDIIVDKHGDYVEVPLQFAMDLPRMDELKINGMVFYDREHDGFNECAREIYRLLGKDGGNRMMQICNQAVMAKVLINQVLPLILPEGLWSRRFPKKILVPGDDSGLMVDIKMDEIEKRVSFSVKVLMKLHSSVEKSFTAHFVAKTEGHIPLRELTRTDLMDHDNPVPNLHVKDIISTLVVNNPAEARELVQKF